MRPDEFCFRGVRLPYLDHPYNTAGLNERSVEVPIIALYVNAAREAGVHTPILELGAVLRHYLPDVPWTVVDAGEEGAGIINSDIMTWNTAERFGLVCSISTIEHIGFGEYTHYAGPTDPAIVIGKLLSLLSEGGTLAATVPLGSNPMLDGHIGADTLGVDRMSYMRRISDDNEWAECDKVTALASTYGKPWPWANAIAILEHGSETLWRTDANEILPRAGLSR